MYRYLSIESQNRKSDSMCVSALNITMPPSRATIASEYHPGNEY